MSGLTDAEREALRKRLASWFGDPRHGFLVSDLKPVVEHIIDARVAAERERIAAEIEAISDRLNEQAWGLSRDPHALRGAQEMFAAKCFSDAATIARRDPEATR